MSEITATNKNTDGLRNRRPTAASSSSNEAKSSNANVGTDPNDLASDEDSNFVRSLLHPTSNSMQRFEKSILALKWIVHIAAIACFVTGIILRTNHLHNGEECDMTYSMRVFLKVKTNAPTTSLATSQYGLFKFVDQRDPRHTQLLRKGQNYNQLLAREEHCAQSSDTIVVYVPGHWGSYDQARSLGAHGIGLTGVREHSLRETQRRLLASASAGSTDSSTNSSMENFVYDVYSVDFAEQGGGLHGQFLRYQTEYLATVLQQLVEDCGVKTNSKKNLIVVAHSMGGYVARKVLQEHPELAVSNLITLATPHSNPLYAFDWSVFDFHQKIVRNERKAPSENSWPLVLSISGGLRDEMIDPSVCKLPSEKEIFSTSSWSFFSGKPQDLSEDLFQTNDPNSLTVLATNLVAKNSQVSSSSLLGMDHRAIVWCHQLLAEVRGMLWILVVSSEATVAERLDKLRMTVGDENLDYETDLSGMKKGSVEKFGWFPSIFMESSMIYNLPYLLSLYASQVALRCARFTSVNRASSMLPVWATILLGWVFRSDLSWLATVIVALVANSFNLLMLRLIPTGFILRKGNQKHNQPLKLLGKVLLVTLLVILLSTICVTAVFGRLSRLNIETSIVQNWFGLFTSILYVYAIATIYAMLIVWMGFIKIEHTTRLGDKNKSSIQSINNAVDVSFDVQLVTFLMMVVPFRVAGSLILVASERQAQVSDWKTLLLLQIPLTILARLRLRQMWIGNDTTGSQNKLGAATTEDRLKIRSILIYLVLFGHFWCYELGLLSRGTGYLVPNLAILLVWVGILQSLLMECPFYI